MLPAFYQLNIVDFREGVQMNTPLNTPNDTSINVEIP